MMKLRFYAQKLIWIAAVYAILYLLFFIAHRVYPTNRAGPGLDLWVFIGIVMFCATSIIQVDKKHELYKCFVHLAFVGGLVALILVDLYW